MYVSETMMRQSITVIRKFTNWLFALDYIDETIRDDLLFYFKDDYSTSLINTRRVNLLFDKLAINSPDYDYEHILEGQFVIEKIKLGELRVIDYFGEAELIGPIVATKEISDLCEDYWELNLMIGNFNERWFVIESGHVYP